MSITVSKAILNWVFIYIHRDLLVNYITLNWNLKRFLRSLKLYVHLFDEPLLWQYNIKIIV